MKAIPKSLNPDPYRKSVAPLPVGPPSFRTTAPPPARVDRILGATGERFDFHEFPAATPLDRAGIAVEASDRTYVTTPEGSIRRNTSVPFRARYPRPLTKKQARQQTKARERIEAELQKQDRRRRERTLRHSLDDSLIRTEKTRKHAEWLLEKLKDGHETVRRLNETTALGTTIKAGIIDDPAAEALP
jgi:hypothetical protein